MNSHKKSIAMMTMLFSLPSASISTLRLLIGCAMVLRPSHLMEDTVWKCKIFPLFTNILSRNASMPIFQKLLHIVKIHSFYKHQNWFHVKYEPQKILEIPHCSLFRRPQYVYSQPQRKPNYSTLFGRLEKQSCQTTRNFFPFFSRWQRFALHWSLIRFEAKKTWPQ